MAFKTAHRQECLCHVGIPEALRGGVGADGYGLGAMRFSDRAVFVFFMLDGRGDEG